MISNGEKLNKNFRFYTSNSIINYYYLPCIFLPESVTLKKAILRVKNKNIIKLVMLLKFMN